MDKKTIFLTCDDGPEADFIEKINYLDSMGIKAIWFCIGEKIKENMEGIVHGIKNGHIIANHSYSHPYFSELTLNEAREELLKTEVQIEKAYKLAGVKQPFKAFRFPYYDLGDNKNSFPPKTNGIKSSEYQKLLKELGFICPKFYGITYKWYDDFGFRSTSSVECTLDFDDWEIDSDSEDIEESYKTVLKRIDRDEPEKGHGLHYKNSNEILLLHTFVELKYFKGLIEKMLKSNVDFKLPKQ